MAVSSLSFEMPQALPQVETECWYGLQTRPRHEKIVAHRLGEKGVTTFLPLVTEVHRWSDRKKTVHVPLFGCYVFAKFTPNRLDRLRVLRVDGIWTCWRRRRGHPDSRSGNRRGSEFSGNTTAWTSHPFLKIGQRVRITSGVLNGMEGILVSRNGDRSLVISVDAIQRSLAVRVEGYEVEPA